MECGASAPLSTNSTIPPKSVQRSNAPNVSFSKAMYGRSTAAPQVRKIATPAPHRVFFVIPFNFQLSTVNFSLHTPTAAAYLTPPAINSSIFPTA
jgi:hypothetical protein